MPNFRKLAIWTRSINLVTQIYKITNTFPASERFGLMSQLQRAAVSVPTNIAEGSAKTSNRDFARFLEISIGSLLELETELIISSNLNYIDSASFIDIQNEIVELQKMITVFKNKLE